MKHPATNYSYDELVEELEKRVQNRIIRATQNDKGLRLYVYSESCVFDKLWDDFTLMARGIILDTLNKDIVALPFTKFFNYSEGITIPQLPFETYEKLDGSLAIIYYHYGEWNVATKGSLNSVQAQLAKKKLDTLATQYLIPGTTYLTEYIGPLNKIVVPYEKEELVLLGSYDKTGYELNFDVLRAIADTVGFRLVKRFTYNNFADLVGKVETLPKDEEGFVLRFENNFRCKIKGDAYLRIHRLISRCTPIAIWEAMLANDDLTFLRKELPEEFWGDFDLILSLLNNKLNDIIDNASKLAKSVEHLSDKEVGLTFEQLPKEYRHFIFSYRKNKGNLLIGKPRQSVFKQFRPTGNYLEGYVASTSINRVQEESN